jgi:hypothetical protein
MNPNLRQRSNKMNYVTEHDVEKALDEQAERLEDRLDAMELNKAFEDLREQLRETESLNNDKIAQEVMMHWKPNTDERQFSWYRTLAWGGMFLGSVVIWAVIFSLLRGM